jgi:hypothetical protein
MLEHKCFISHESRGENHGLVGIACGDLLTGIQSRGETSPPIRALALRRAFTEGLGFTFFWASRTIYTPYNCRNRSSDDLAFKKKPAPYKEKLSLYPQKLNRK